MGLDSVEFLMAVEETFGVEISDQEAQTTFTPAELAGLVLTKIETTSREGCLSQKAFHLLRRTFTQVLELPRTAFRPDSQLEKLVPWRKRAAIWEELRQKTGATKWPKLQRPPWVVSVLAGVMLAAFMFLPGALHAPAPTLGWALSWALGALAAIGVTAFGWLVTQPLKNYISRRTVAEMAQFIVAYNPELVTTDAQWTPERMRLAFRDLLIEHSGSRDFSEDTPFKKISGV